MKHTESKVFKVDTEQRICVPNNYSQPLLEHEFTSLQLKSFSLYLTGISGVNCKTISFAFMLKYRILAACYLTRI